MTEHNSEFLIDGRSDARETLVLAHGAGAPMDSPFMDAIAVGLAARGLRVVRFEFPYMRERRAGRRRGPDRTPALLTAWAQVIEKIGPDGLVIGGKSMGGRIASMVADDSHVGGVVCLGYPFHPPGRPDKLRVAHLERLRTPALIVQGTRDRFGSRDEVARYDLSERVRLHWLEDGDHSFVPRVRSGRTLEQNMSEAIDAITGFVAELRGEG